MVAYSTIRNGSWTDVVPATTPWNPVPGAGGPTAGDHVVITHDVLLDASSSIGDATVNHAVDIGAGGILRWPVNANVTLTCSGTNTTKSAINIASGGILQLGSSGAEIGAAFIARILMTAAQRKILVTTAGEVRLYGSPNYRTERTTAVADVASGVGVTFETADTTNWVNNDWVWIGTGAKKTTAPTDTERVQITVVDATHFTCTTASNHVAGDIIVNEMRNVIIDGNAAAGGFSIIATNTIINSNAYNLQMYVRASWAKFIYYGFTSNNDGILITASGTATSWAVPANCFLVEHCTFAYPYAVSVDAMDINFSIFPLTDSGTAFTSNHFYADALAGATAVDFDVQSSIYTLNNFTIIGNFVQGIWGHSGAGPRLVITDLWASQASGASMATLYAAGSLQVSNCNFYSIQQAIFNVGYVHSPLTNVEDNTIANCKFYHIGATADYAIYFTDMNSFGIRNTYVTDCEFYDAAHDGVKFGGLAGGRIIFERCTFDGLNTSGVTTNGAVVASTTTSNWGIIEFISCDFGMTAANLKNNVLFPYATQYIYNVQLRAIFENCRFKLPTGFAFAQAGSGDYPTALGWMCVDYLRHWNNWYDRAIMPDSFSLEFINCQALDGALVDQFQVAYPGVTRWGMAGGAGSEMMDEPTVKLDGSLAMKFVPFGCVTRSQFNRKHPIKFSVANGKTVTVKVSLRKHLSQNAGRRPMVHMYGCGINTYSEMSNVNDSWEQHVITGVTTHGGDMSIWFSGISEWEAASGGAGDALDITYSPATVGTYYFWADGFSITIT